MWKYLLKYESNFRRLLRLNKKVISLPILSVLTKTKSNITKENNFTVLTLKCVSDLELGAIFFKNDLNALHPLNTCSCRHIIKKCNLNVHLKGIREERSVTSASMLAINNKNGLWMKASCQMPTSVKKVKLCLFTFQESATAAYFSFIKLNTRF